MDVIKPELMWIDGRCYRLPLIDPAFNGDGGDEGNTDKEIGDWESLESKILCTEEEPCDADFFIEETANGRFKMQVPVPKTFWGSIIGAKGATRKRIENDTKAIITIPRQAQHGDVLITGSTKRSIILARRNIDVIVASSRQRLEYTHFISIPMISDEIKKNFITFKELVLKTCGRDRGIDASIFQNPEKLHLTLGMLVLVDNNERRLAGEKLEEACNQILRPLLHNKKPCVIEMKGIEYMNDDPHEVDVLFARVNLINENNILQQAADSLVQNFVNTGFLKKDDVQGVKLHVTLMNTLFREEKNEEISDENDFGNNKGRKSKKRTTFNAANILKQYQNYYFGKQEFSEIHISVRFTKASNGFYESSYVAKI